MDVLDSYTNFPSEGFEKQIDTFYPLAVDLLGRDLSPEIRTAIQALFRRVGEVKLGLTPAQPPSQASISPRSSISQQFAR